MCSVPCCKNRKGRSPGISFHEFPCNLLQRQKWLDSVGRGPGPGQTQPWVPSQRSYICSRHFLPEDFVTGKKIRILKPGAVPTVFGNYPKYKPQRPTQCDVEKKHAPYISVLKPLQIQENSKNFSQPDKNIAITEGTSSPPPAPERAVAVEATSTASQPDECIKTLEVIPQLPQPNESIQIAEVIAFLPQPNEGIRIVEVINQFLQQNESVQTVEKCVASETTASPPDSGLLPAPTVPRASRPSQTRTTGVDIARMRRRIYTLERKCRTYRAKLEKLDHTAVLATLEQKEAEKKLSKYNIAALEQKVEAGDPCALFLKEQLGVLNKAHHKWSEETLKYCQLWSDVSPTSYTLIRDSKVLYLPSLKTIVRSKLRSCTNTALVMSTASADTEVIVFCPGACQMAMESDEVSQAVPMQIVESESDI